MNDLIGIDITGVKELIEKLEKLPANLGDAGTERANKYIVEYERIYPGSKKGERFQWTSAKQRAAFFATNGFGRGIPTQRSFQLRWGWKVQGKGRSQTVINDTPYTRWVKTDADQQIGLKQRGWDTIETDLRERQPKITEAFDRGVREEIKKEKLE
jgi:hypothetical protein